MLTQSYTELFRSGVGECRVCPEKFAGQAQPVPFGERLASSQAFAELFREGMALVEENSDISRWTGASSRRSSSALLHWLMRRKACVSTTRLMQLASWLLLHRAVKEGEMCLRRPARKKARSSWRRPTTTIRTVLNCCRRPFAISSRARRSFTAKVRRLDATIYNQGSAERPATANPVRTAAWPSQGGFRD